jgi:hypothetical protein
MCLTLLGVEPKTDSHKDLQLSMKSEDRSKSKIEVDACPNNQPIRAVEPCIVGCVTQPIVTIELVM